MQHESVFQIEIETQFSFNKDSGGLEFLNPFSLTSRCVECLLMMMESLCQKCHCYGKRKGFFS